MTDPTSGRGKASEAVERADAIDLHHVAHHEAGHAVAAEALGFDVGLVSIEEDAGEGTLGRAFHSELAIPADTPDSEWRVVVGHYVQVCLAGLAAECILDADGWVPESASSDVEEALEYVTGLKGEAASEADLAPYRQAVDDLLRRRWHAVRVLAEKLLKLGHLYDAYPVIQEALELGPDVQADDVLTEEELRPQAGL